MAILGPITACVAAVPTRWSSTYRGGLPVNDASVRTGGEERWPGERQVARYRLEDVLYSRPQSA